MSDAKREENQLQGMWWPCGAGRFMGMVWTRGGRLVGHFNTDGKEVTWTKKSGGEDEVELEAFVLRMVPTDLSEEVMRELDEWWENFKAGRPWLRDV